MYHSVHRTQLLSLFNLILTGYSLLLNLVDILYKRSTALTASFLFMHHLLGTLLDVPTETDFDRLAGTSEFVNTLASFLDEEVVDLFQSQVGGFGIAVQRCQYLRWMVGVGTGLPEVD